ncbi:MAG: hypothetical protein LBL62_01945 [Planctomycetaceae bacterium]|nr:hypothetical protein [Planctomycetaceae bacterium]
MSILIFSKLYFGRFYDVGDLSPKGWSALADSTSVFGWQFVLSTGLLSDFRPNSKASRLSPTQCFGETSPPLVLYLIFFKGSKSSFATLFST